MLRIRKLYFVRKVMQLVLVTCLHLLAVLSAMICTPPVPVSPAVQPSA